MCHCVLEFEWLGYEADQLTGSHQIRSFDLFLAAVQTVVTFSVAYPASVALGSVLLQTSPARGLTNGRMEAFLRVMKEVRFSSLSNPPSRAFITRPTIDRETSSSPSSAPTSHVAVDALYTDETVSRGHFRIARSKGLGRRRRIKAE